MLTGSCFVEGISIGVVTLSFSMRKLRLCIKWLNFCLSWMAQTVRFCKNVQPVTVAFDQCERIVLNVRERLGVSLYFSAKREAFSNTSPMPNKLRPTTSCSSV